MIAATLPLTRGLSCLTLLCTPIPASLRNPPADTTVVRMLTKHAYRFELGEGGITGEGARFLRNRAAQSAFFLIGEEHGTVEIPRLASALLPELKRLGYGAYAIETGAVTTDSLVRRMRAGDGSYEEFLRRYPMGVAFFDWVGETNLLRVAVRNGYAVWGLDQEFTGAGPHFLDWLLPFASGDAGRATIERYATEARGENRRAGSGESSATFLMSATPAAFDSLRAATGVRKGSASPAARMIDEWQESAAIYQLWAGGGATNYESNYRRIRLMKHHLTDRLRAAGWFRGGGDPPEKVVIKYGSDHVVRGYTDLHQLDLGDYTAELAASVGTDSFNLMVAALQGREEDGTTWELASAAPALAPIAEAAGPLTGDHWVVFDLAALRPWIHRSSNEKGREDLARWIWRYDAMILGPRLTPAPRLGS